MTHQDDLNNHANQLNPNNDEYRGPEHAGIDDGDWGDDDGPGDDSGGISSSSPPSGSAPTRHEIHEVPRLEREILLHLLEHRGQQIRFEASEWTTEFGVLRKFVNEDSSEVKRALRVLEESRLIYRRTQYIVGHSDLKHVFSLTPSGHKQALAYRRGEPASAEPTATQVNSESFTQNEDISASPSSAAVPTVAGETVRFCGQCGTPVVNTSRPRSNVCAHCAAPIVMGETHGTTTHVRETTPARDASPPDDDDDTSSYSDDGADDNPADDWQSDSND
jgi:hypothetical protein